jgi:hypothetical protein
VKTGDEENGSLPQRRDVYYGWIIAGTLALTETASWGILYYAFSVFLSPCSRSWAGPGRP